MTVTAVDILSRFWTDKAIECTRHKVPSDAPESEVRRIAGIYNVYKGLAVPRNVTRGWYQRNRIPAERFESLMQLAERMDVPLSRRELNEQLRGG